MCRKLNGSEIRSSVAPLRIVYDLALLKLLHYSADTAMNNNYTGYVTFLVLILLAGCGGSGASSGDSPSSTATGVKSSSLSTVSSSVVSSVDSSSAASLSSSNTSVSSSSNVSISSSSSDASVSSSVGNSSSVGSTSSSIESSSSSSVVLSSSSSSQASLSPSISNWSDANSWSNGMVPIAGDSVIIPEGQTIILDVSPPALSGLTINGELRFAEQTLSLTSAWIMVHGRLAIGSQAQPFPRTHTATITLTGTNMNDPGTMGMGTRGIVVHGGTLDLYSNYPKPTWTQLNATAAAGTSSLTLKESVDWSSNAQIVIAPTDFYNVDGRTEKINLASASGTSVNLANPLNHNHWGRLQYVQNNSGNAITYSPTTAVTNKVIDERAEVGNLTRNIVIQGADDALWQSDLFGAHVMIMYPGVAHVDGVEFTRVGQAGRLGRYPFHWHLWSYNTNGSLRGSATGQFVKHSSIHNSGQRCIVIHGTNGVTLEDNICYDITGHGIFLEDAVERDNVIERNLVLKVKEVAERHKMLEHERQGHRAGPSGFWITNPHNIIRNNTVADTERLGFWFALPARPLGLSSNVNIRPQHYPFGVFDNNVAHSTLAEGLLFDNVPIDDQGNTSDLTYIPLVGGASGNASDPFQLNGMTIYKVGVQNNGPIWERITGGTLNNFVIADFGGRAFNGASRCAITNNLIVGSTRNNANHDRIYTPPVGTASYHSLCEISDNIFVNLPAVQGVPSGAFAADDYYTEGVDRGLIQNAGNLLIDANPGYRTSSPNTRQRGQGLEYFSLSGALWDPYGYWGDPESYWVLNLPFLTTDQDCQPVRDPVHGNDVSCSNSFFGIAPIYLTGSTQENDNRAVRFTREDLAGNFIGEWFIDDGRCTGFLGIMRSASLANEGIYRIDFPGSAGQLSDRASAACSPRAPVVPDENILLSLSGMKAATDSVILNLPFAGGVTPTIAYLTSWPNADEVVNWEAWRCYQEMQQGATSCANGEDWTQGFRANYFRPYTAAATKADMLNSPNCDTYFRDTVNNRVWTKLCRNNLAMFSGDPLVEDSVLYQKLRFVFKR